jgi:hypothetical protein
MKKSETIKKLNKLLAEWENSRLTDGKCAKEIIELLKPTESKPLGEHLLKLEEVLDQMIDEHELQWGDILGLVYTHLMVHRPDAREEYVEGGHPEFYYGEKKICKNYKVHSL